MIKIFLIVDEKEEPETYISLRRKQVMNSASLTTETGIIPR